jgi:hypothetical protein
MFDDYPTIALDPIPGFPGYLVNRLGVIFSTHASFGGLLQYPLPMKLHREWDGYLIVKLRRDGRQYRRRVHQLVLETYIGPRPFGMETRHMNNIRDDNMLSNLRWGTARENGADKRLAGTGKGVRNGRAKLTEDDIRIIRSMRPCDAARQFEIDEQYASLIRTRKRWGHVE